jgi:hypothetical protein
MALSVLYIEYDLNARMNFKQAASRITSVLSLSVATSLGEALEKIRDDQSFDIIYISSRFSRDASAKFIEAAKGTEVGSHAVFMCVCSGVYCTANVLADYASIGFEGFLLAPYSVESFHETFAIAEKLLVSHASRSEDLAVRLLVRATVVNMVDCARRTRESKPLTVPHAELRRTAEIVRALPKATRRRFKEAINQQFSDRTFKRSRRSHEEQFSARTGKVSNL